ncbi:MAG TPA: TonB-dependent receptor plug domain-containing protein [Phycisphaerae bacterium]|nr:TonB-dependent receptor plug domain-containing protein [Phycisphaerae bacterium]
MGHWQVRLALVCLVGLWAGATTAGAAEPGDAPTEGPASPTGAELAPELLLWQEIPTVISASRREEPASRAPNAVSIITREQIHESGLTTLGDLMRMAVGVDVGRADNSLFSIGVRGLHGKWANSTLVLMDGRTIYNPAWGGTAWAWQPVLVEDIERIEVVRGPGGAAWGANAANGVINIITRKPGDTPGLFLSQTLTSRLDSLTYLRYGVTAGNLDLRLSAGYDSLPEIGVREGPGNHDFVRMPRANLRSTYHFDKVRSLDVDAGYADGVMGSTPDLVLFAGAPFAGARWFPQAHYLRLRYTHEEAHDDLWSVQYYLNRQTMDESEGGAWLRYTQHDIEAQRVQRVGDRHVLTWGGNFRADVFTNGDPPGGGGSQGVRLDNERTLNRQGGPRTNRMLLCQLGVGPLEPARWPS